MAHRYGDTLRILGPQCLKLAKKLDGPRIPKSALSELETRLLEVAAWLYETMADESK